MKFGACAPSNIAFVKYMGKKPDSGNIPENGSLSMTLDRLCTFVELSPTSSPTLSWVPELPRLSVMESHLKGCGLTPTVPKLDDAGIAKVVRHFERVREKAPAILAELGLKARQEKTGFELRSANTFPAASGIASSASSFAAITLATAASVAQDEAAFRRLYSESHAFRRELAKLSRQGSGSSCRSFEGSFVAWEIPEHHRDGDATKYEETFSVASRLPELAHFVLVVSAAEKKVSSSQAHIAVRSSPLWNGRVARAEDRLAQMKRALESGDLRAVSRLAWADAWEMHSLFHTASEPFSYWEPETIAALQFLSPFMRPSSGEDSPPIVTLDAGPNVHLTVRSSESARWKSIITEIFPMYTLLVDRPGRGAFLC